MNLENYPFAVYATQGGGYARFVGNTLIFIEAPPNQCALRVGMEVPKEWDFQPANSKARIAEQVKELDEDFDFLDKLL